MTEPGYRFGTGVRLIDDKRLKAYLGYLQKCTDLISSGITGIQMSYSFQADYSTKTFQVSSGGYVEMPVGSILSRTKIDLSLYDEIRLNMFVDDHAGSAAEYGVQYSPDNGTTWLWLDGVDGPTVEVYANGSPWPYAGVWVAIEPAAQTTVTLRLVGDNNEGVAAKRNVRVAQTHIECRKLWDFERPIMDYDEYIQYASDNGYDPYGPEAPVPTT